MPLTKQQLLIPRVLCIGAEAGKRLYPHSEVFVGDILTLDHFGHVFISETGRWVGKADISDFPHLFKPIPWWERDERELPDFVWQKEDIYSVDKYDLKRGYIWLVPPEFGHSAPVELDTTTPADLSDYQEYQKQKEA